MKSSRVMLILKVVVILCMLAVLTFCWNAGPWNVGAALFVMVVIFALLCLDREDAGPPPDKPKPTDNKESDDGDTLCHIDQALQKARIKGDGQEILSLLLARNRIVTSQSKTRNPSDSSKYTDRD